MEDPKGINPYADGYQRDKRTPKYGDNRLLTFINVLLLTVLGYLIYSEHVKTNSLTEDMTLIRQEKALLETTLGAVQAALKRLENDEGQLKFKVKTDESVVDKNSDDVSVKLNNIRQTIQDITAKEAADEKAQKLALEKLQADKTKVDQKQQQTEKQISQNLEMSISSNARQIAKLQGQITKNQNQILKDEKSDNQKAVEQQKQNSGLFSQIQKLDSAQANYIQQLNTQISAQASKISAQAGQISDLTKQVESIGNKAQQANDAANKAQTTANIAQTQASAAADAAAKAAAAGKKK